MASTHSSAVRAAAACRLHFYRDPDVVATAPGRVNLIGEHTDYNNGFVLPMPIRQRCSAAVIRVESPAPPTLLAHAADLNETREIGLPVRPADVEPGSWLSYVAGVAGVMGLQRSLQIVVASDVPFGSGLSSSASLEVSVARAIGQATGIMLDGPAMAHECQRAEHDFAGVPCGIMDQTASACGRPGHAMLLDCRSLEVEHIPFPDPKVCRVLVVNTNVRHSLAGGEYGKRRAACFAAAAKLGAESLREVSHQLLHDGKHLLTEEQLRVATHILNENDRVVAFAAALRSSDFAQTRTLMHASHESLRTLYRVSCDELDVIAHTAHDVPGCHGARMTGGGFGGCSVTLVDPGARPELEARVSRAFLARFGKPCTFIEV